MILYGYDISNNILNKIKYNVLFYYMKYNIYPKLVIIFVGNDVTSSIFIRRKFCIAKFIGIKVVIKQFCLGVPEGVILKEIQCLNIDNSVSGIIVQLPLPRYLSEQNIVVAIDPKKDVDGLHPYNLSLLFSNNTLNYIPCAAFSCVTLIKSKKIKLCGQNVVIIGRSNLVGKPLMCLLLQEHCTITLCHSHTLNLLSLTSQADIVISAIGNPHFFKSNAFNKNVMVIDVGTTLVNTGSITKLNGDVDFENVKDKVKFITPVPGGVGPITISYLLYNVFKAMLMVNFKAPSSNG